MSTRPTSCCCCSDRASEIRSTMHLASQSAKSPARNIHRSLLRPPCHPARLIDSFGCGRQASRAALCVHIALRPKTVASMKMQDREEARIAWTARWRWAHDVNRVIRWGPCRGSRQCGGRQNAEVFAELRTGNYLQRALIKDMIKSIRAFPTNTTP